MGTSIIGNSSTNSIDMNIYLREVLDCIRKLGYAKTCRHMYGTVCDFSFDWKYKTNTMAWERLSDLEIGSPNKDRGGDYHGTRADPFRRLMENLNPPTDGVFVDFGCGKGKTLMLAMEHGFRRVVGIEFSPELVGCAVDNLAKYAEQTKHQSDVKVICSDVVDYPIEDDQDIFYIFNAFDDVILLRVLENIRRSLDRAVRPIWLIYYNPDYGEMIENKIDFLTKCKAFEYRGCVFHVYTNAGAAITT